MQLIQPSSGPLLQVGGRIITDLSANLIRLFGVASNVNYYATLRLASSAVGAGYQVPSGKTLHVIAAQIASYTNAAVGASLGYGDTDIGFSSGTGPTNPAGVSGASGANFTAGSNIAGILSVSAAVELYIPALKYPLIVLNAGSALSASVFVWGYLE